MNTLLHRSLLILFLLSFAAVVSRLFELGVPTEQFASADPWIMKSSDEK